jgi:hypothetical protein
MHQKLSRESDVPNTYCETFSTHVTSGGTATTAEAASLTIKYVVMGKPFLTMWRI